MDLAIALKALGSVLFAGALWLVLAALAIELFFRLARAGAPQRGPVPVTSEPSIRAAASGSRR
jgi:hypothetical protein